MGLALGISLALGIPLTGCQQEAEAPQGGGAGFETAEIPGPPATELGDAYQRAYVDMANAYMEILQADYNAALTHAKAAQQELGRIRQQGGETLPETVTDDLARVDEAVTMLQERHPAAAQRLQDLMMQMTRHAQEYDLARAHGAGGGAGATERKFEGPGVAQPEPPVESQPRRHPQEGPH